MADKPKKPRRDLRARLGRTITPQTAGADAPVAAPPGMGGAVSAPAPSSVTPPPGSLTPPPSGIAAPPAGIAAPPAGVAPAGLDVAPPPFGAPGLGGAPDPFSPAASQAPAEPAPPQVVRLEFDDKLVTDVDTGRKSRGKIMIMAAVLLSVGIAVGWGSGSMLEQRAIYNVTVRDGHSIYTSVTESRTILLEAQTQINTILASATGEGGADPSVNFEAIEALRALSKPFDAGAFTGKNYNAFAPGAVHDLITYTMNVQKLWEGFSNLAATTLPDSQRTALAETAASPAQVVSQVYGAVLRRVDGRLLGSMGYLAFEEVDGQPKVMYRSTRHGAPHEMQVFAGDQTVTEEAEFVVLVDGSTSIGVIRNQMGAFGRFLVKLQELRVLMQSTVEVSGRLETALGEVARLDEI